MTATASWFDIFNDYKNIEKQNSNTHFSKETDHNLNVSSQGSNENSEIQCTTESDFSSSSGPSLNASSSSGFGSSRYIQKPKDYTKWPKKKREHVFSYGTIKISIPKESESVDLLSVLTHGPLRGYDRANAKAALACFVERRLIIIDQTEIKNCKEYNGWGGFAVENWVTVPSLDQGNQKGYFKGEGNSIEEAEQTCVLKILEDLFEFNVIKEANVEFQKGRKELQPERGVDLKTLAYVNNNSAEFFGKFIDEIAMKEHLFY